MMKSMSGAMSGAMSSQRSGEGSAQGGSASASAEGDDPVATGSIEVSGQTVASYMSNVITELNSSGAAFRLSMLFGLSKSPALTLVSFSMFKPAATSVLLFVCKTTSILMLNALFYQNTGALSADSSVDCSFENVWQKIGKSIFIGIFSLILGDLPVLLFAQLHARDIRYCRQEQKGGILKKWRVKSRILWVVGPLYMAFCVFFVLLFLANVRTMDAIDWLVASGIAVFQQNIIKPILIGLAFFALMFFGLFAPWVPRRKRDEVILLTVKMISGGDPNRPAHRSKGTKRASDRQDDAAVVEFWAAPRQETQMEQKEREGRLVKTLILLLSCQVIGAILLFAVGMSSGFLT